MIQDEIMKLQTYKMFEGDSDIYVMRDDVLEVLKQEPCKDCISRQAVLGIIHFEDNWLYDTQSHNANTVIAFSGLKSKVKALQPVTPESEDKE